MIIYLYDVKTNEFNIYFLLMQAVTKQKQIDWGHPVFLLSLNQTLLKMNGISLFVIHKRQLHLVRLKHLEIDFFVFMKVQGWKASLSIGTHIIFLSIFIYLFMRYVVVISIINNARSCVRIILILFIYICALNFFHLMMIDGSYFSRIN